MSGHISNLNLAQPKGSQNELIAVLVLLLLCHISCVKSLAGLCFSKFSIINLNSTIIEKALYSSVCRYSNYRKYAQETRQWPEVLDFFTGCASQKLTAMWGSHVICDNSHMTVGLFTHTTCKMCNNNHIPLTTA